MFRKRVKLEKEKNDVERVFENNLFLYRSLRGAHNLYQRENDCDNIL